MANPKERFYWVEELDAENRLPRPRGGEHEKGRNICISIETPHEERTVTLGRPLHRSQLPHPSFPPRDPCLPRPFLVAARLRPAPVLHDCSRLEDKTSFWVWHIQCSVSAPTRTC